MKQNPVPIEVTDQALRTRILRLLQARQSACLSGLDIGVSQGTLVMAGCVPSRAVRRTIRKCCRHVPGVRDNPPQTTSRASGIVRSRIARLCRHFCGLTSVVLVPAGSHDVVPGGCLMTLLALIDFGVRFSCDAGGDHAEVHHVMAWRGLMALRTVC